MSQRKERPLHQQFTSGQPTYFPVIPLDFFCCGFRRGGSPPPKATHPILFLPPLTLCSIFILLIFSIFPCQPINVLNSLRTNPTSHHSTLIFPWPLPLLSFLSQTFGQVNVPFLYISLVSTHPTTVCIPLIVQKVLLPRSLMTTLIVKYD